MSSAAPSAARSSSAARTRAPEARAPRPTLRVLEGPVQRVRRIPFLVSCMTLLCLGLLALLGLNIGLARGSYEVTMLQKQQQQLLERTQNLNEQLDQESSPAVLSSRAKALGMVSSGAPVFIQLSDGRILGDPKESVPQQQSPSVDLASPSPTTSTPSTSSGSASESGSASPSSGIAYPSYTTPGKAVTGTSSASGSAGSSSPSASGSATPSATAGSTPSATSTAGTAASPGDSTTASPSTTSGSTQPTSPGSTTSTGN